MKKKKYIYVLSIASLLCLASCSFVGVSNSNTSLTNGTNSNSSADSSLVNSSPITSNEILDSSSVVSIPLTDPYEDIDTLSEVIGFYTDYKEATSYEDAQYRTAHNLMSGDINDYGETPLYSTHIAKNSDGLCYKVTDAIYEYNLDGSYKSYTTLSLESTKRRTIFYNGGYTSLNDVASYIMAFGEVPPNYIAGKSTNDMNKVMATWWKFGRVNFSSFSYDPNYTNGSKRPYEPLLKDIVYNGEGNLRYYEVDIGTTGTTSDIDKYPPAIYNNGTKITRGAARIVFSYMFKNGEIVKDINTRNVYYTYNHYNDFVEYLNYDGGFGTMFGNVTSGNKFDTNSPTYPVMDFIPSVKATYNTIMKMAK